LGLSASVAAAGLIARSVFGTDLAASVGRAVGAPYGDGSQDPAWLGYAVLLGLAWLVALAYTWRRTGQSAMGPQDAALWLDLRSDASGRVVTANEVTEESAQPWRAQAISVAETAEAVPNPRWGRLAQAGLLGLALVFAVTFVPLRAQGGGTGQGIAAVFEERLDEVAEQLEVLDESVGLDEEERSELEASLERLEEAIEEDPDLEATYEAIDRLEDQLAALAEEALAEAKQALADMAEQQRSSAESSASAEDPLGADTQPQGADLESLLSKLAQSESGLAEASLSPEALSELSKIAAEDLSNLSLEELAELSEALASAMSEPLGALAQAGLLSESAASVSAFKPAGELPALTPEQLAMLSGPPEPCPVCGKLPPGDCEAAGGT
jgi:archaellum component FlaC